MPRVWTRAALQEILLLAHGIGGLRALKEVILVRASSDEEDGEGVLSEDLTDHGLPETILQSLTNAQLEMDTVVLVDVSSHVRLRR